MSYLGGNDSGPWDSDEQYREFVLQTPDLDQQLLFLPVWARAAGTDRTVGGGSVVFGGVKDASTLILPVNMDLEYPGPGAPSLVPKVPVARGDLPLRYFYGEPREALCTFTGPFLPGKTVQADQGRPYRLTPQPVASLDGTLLQFHFTTDQPFRADVPVLLHDKQGRRYLADGMNGRSGLQGADLTYLAGAVPWDEIAAVTAGEKPYEITFRNVAVRYPNRPPRSHAAYLDVMAQRLGLTGMSPDRLRQYTVKSPQEAIAVIDAVRGDWHIRTTFEVLDRARPPINVSELDQATQQKIRQVAARWAGSGSVSHYGIQLGLIGRWPEFFDLATDRLGSDYQTDHLVHQHEQRWHEANREIASALSRYWTELRRAASREDSAAYSRCSRVVLSSTVSSYACGTPRPRKPLTLSGNWRRTTGPGYGGRRSMPGTPGRFAHAAGTTICPKRSGCGCSWSKAVPMTRLSRRRLRRCWPGCSRPSWGRWLGKHGAEFVKGSCGSSTGKRLRGSTSTICDRCSLQ